MRTFFRISYNILKYNLEKMFTSHQFSQLIRVSTLTQMNHKDQSLILYDVVNINLDHKDRFSFLGLGQL